VRAFPFIHAGNLHQLPPAGRAVLAPLLRWLPLINPHGFTENCALAAIALDMSARDGGPHQAGASARAHENNLLRYTGFPPHTPATYQHALTIFRHHTPASPGPARPGPVSPSRKSEVPGASGQSIHQDGLLER
jgi:hypothetical protein